jgi:hypothetical protein
MTSIFRALTAVAVLVACVAVIGSVGASAQDDPDGDGPGITVNTTSGQDTTEYAQEIDKTLRLISWEYDSEREGFVLVFESDRSTTITITEAIQFEEGAGSGRIYRERIPEGQSKVFVQVRKRGGEAAVTMTTPRSIQNNRYSYVSTGTRVDRGPIEYQVVQMLIVGTAIASAGGAFVIVRRRREKETKEVERVL